MEINDPNGDSNSIWYVTDGLLAKELITGQMQVGSNAFVRRGDGATRCWSSGWRTAGNGAIVSPAARREMLKFGS